MSMNIEQADSILSWHSWNATKKVQQKKETFMSRAQFLALCWALFMIGWRDGSAGPLLVSFFLGLFFIDHYLTLFSSE